MTLSGIFLILFIIISLVHIACEARQLLIGRYSTKPLLMPTLGLYYVTSAPQTNFIFLAALACCWLGDIFLMVTSRQKEGRYFKIGLVSFLLGHLLYITVFSSYLPHVINMPLWGLGCIAVYFAAGYAGYRLIAPHTGRMLPAVIAYIIILVLMGGSTVIPLGSVRLAGAVTAMAGALLFMISDAVNAYDRFIKKPPLEWMLTMGAYLTGQFLIVQGYLWF